MNLQTPGQALKIKAVIAFVLFVSIPFSSNAKQAIVEDSDGDGLSDQYENRIGTEAYLPDTDGDGIKDAIEVGKNLDKPLDSDGDKRIDALDYDDDNDGLPSILESKVDTDKDSVKDYLDTDSDNDGVADGIEAGMLSQDKNHDFIDDAFDAERTGAVDNNGDGINDNLTLPDHNNDGIPDYLDAEFKKKVESKVAKRESTVIKPADKKELNDKQKTGLTGIESKVENKEVKLVDQKSNKYKFTQQKTKIKAKKEAVKKVVINRYTDTDNDGLLDTQEKVLGTNPLKRDSDDDKVSDAIEIGLDINTPQDSDHDGKIDALDSDDDNDGVLTMHEDINKDSSPINDDTDDDGVPDYLDANDDGDNKLTLEEGSEKDTDRDGILDYLDNNDGVKDVAPVITKIEPIPETPEVIVLFDGDAASLADESTEEPETQNEFLDKTIAEKAINDAINLGTENASLVATKEKQASKDNPLKKETGIMAWLTSLLPD